MNYDISKPAPLWAVREAFNRLSMTAVAPLTDTAAYVWSNLTLPGRHLAWMIATYEKAPVDPQVILARRLYKAAYTYTALVDAILGGEWVANTENVEDDDKWKSTARITGVNAIVEILNEAR